MKSFQTTILLARSFDSLTNYPSFQTNPQYQFERTAFLFLNRLLHQHHLDILQPLHHLKPTFATHLRHLQHLQHLQQILDTRLHRHLKELLTIASFLILLWAIRDIHRKHMHLAPLAL